MYGHKMAQNNKIWTICANTNPTGLKFCGVDVPPEQHIVIAVMMSP